MHFEFTFPEGKTVYNGTIKDFSINEKWIDYIDIDINNPKNNIITIGNVEYYFTYLSNESPYNSGGNSIILKLYEAQNFDIEDINYEKPDLILKILKFPNKAANRTPSKSTKRFLKEISSLEKCKENHFQNIIILYQYGICKIYDSVKKRYLDYQYYTMEYAEHTLKTFIESNHSTITYEEKISLCRSLGEGLKELDSLRFYHRDIKPDNIFMTENNTWKIGDLGLIDERQSETKIDDIAEPIGPRGWMSPESMNKHLCEGKEFAFQHNCKIDHQSDIFQLGKVFWYIFQHNAPIGTVKESDFMIRNSEIFSIIKTMLNHSKKKRYSNIDEVIKLLKPLEAKSLKIAV